MTFYVEKESKDDLPFDPQEVLVRVAEQILKTEGCPYETQVNLLLTDDNGIWEYNRTYRSIDRPTDVLSFPNVAYEAPADWAKVEDHAADCFEPDSGELILGDIIISVERAMLQASEYGHSILREFAFLVAHSMLHLCGYDHMEEAEALIMETKQKEALEALHITRED